MCEKQGSAGANRGGTGIGPEMAMRELTVEEFLDSKIKEHNSYCRTLEDLKNQLGSSYLKSPASRIAPLGKW